MSQDTSRILEDDYATERKVLWDFVPPHCRRLLDVGCYAGAFGAAMKKRQAMEVWGLEANRQGYEVARTRLDHVFNDLFTDQLDLPQHHFDAITFSDSLEHFADPVPALRYCRELLAPDGIIVCTLPNVRHVANLEHILFEKDWQYTDAGIRDRTHLRFFTKLSMNRLFAECGFETVKQVGINEDWWSAEKRLRRLMFRLFPGFTDDMRYIQYVNVLRPARAPAR